MTCRHRFGRWLPLIAMLSLLAGVDQGIAEEQGPSKKATRASGGGLLPGADSKEPVSIDAGKLDYFDKEAKLVYAGNVVAKQGESTLRASVLTIFLTREAKKTEATAGTAEPAGPSGSSIRRMEAQGPVTVVAKDEVGTGDTGSYDKADNKITLNGNVTLTQATNVIKGDRLVYDMTTGQAQVSSGHTAERVTSVFTPGSSGPGNTLPARKAKPGDAVARKPQSLSTP